MAFWVPESYELDNYRIFTKDFPDLLERLEQLAEVQLPVLLVPAVTEGVE